MEGRLKTDVGGFYADANLIAHWTNLGYVNEAAIRNHILQSLISHSKLYDHQANALIILFKLAGATFGAYVDPSVVDRCFKLLQDHKYHNPYRDMFGSSRDSVNGYDRMKREQVQVCTPRPVKCSHRTEASFQDAVALWERGWEGLPSPPTFRTGREE